MKNRWIVGAIAGSLALMGTLTGCDALSAAPAASSESATSAPAAPPAEDTPSIQPLAEVPSVTPESTPTPVEPSVEAAPTEEPSAEETTQAPQPLAEVPSAAPVETEEETVIDDDYDELADTDGCTIKGNINSKREKIYHMPDQQHYDRTEINEAKGERWFCTEAEAREAGWRKSSASPPLTPSSPRPALGS